MFIILGIAIVSAVGTVVEAQYDTKVAQTLVFHSPYMYALLWLLCITLFLVMVDRWPWKKRHTAFILAHIGIITLLVGSYITRKVGIDGSVYLESGKQTNVVTLPDNILSVYASFGGNYTNLFSEKIDFLTDPPSKEDPYKVSLGGDELQIIDYWHFALRESRFVETQNLKHPPAVRFQIFGSRANSTQWLALTDKKKVVSTSLGPLRVVLTKEYDQKKHQAATPGGNQILFTVLGDNKIKYEIYSAKKAMITKRGVVGLGDEVVTGFMDFKIRLLNFYAHHEEKVTYTDNVYPNNYTKPALLVNFNGKQQWMGKNSVLKLFKNDRAYIVTLGDDSIELNFPIKLKKFILGRYQGTMRAASYASDVTVDNKLDVNISMNEPLKYDGYTFYQASFQQDDMGNPVASILSVNKDPGRFLKYLGSLLIVLGSIHLFYNRRRKVKVKKNNEKK
ncbi:MAG: cytochrome c biogenesis protein [Bdellovibrionaceae bacterium]|nr:cytochrome c biogenesis protein [Pseudobdellovibrionaceae bacterium]